MKRTIIIILLLLLIIVNNTFASDGNSVYKFEVENNHEYLIDGWDRLPFKDIRPLDTNYINWVNNNYGLNWDPTPLPAPDKCLSYAAATMNDWYRYTTGMPLGVYQNYVNNQTENGTNPRALEAVYLTHSGLFQSIFESYYDFIPFDPITGEDMPYDIKGYADIMTGNFPIWLNVNDELLGSDYKISVTAASFAEKPVFKAESNFGEIFNNDGDKMHHKGGL